MVMMALPKNIFSLTLVAASVLTALYILTNQIESFPLYFFCDEAINGVEARSILQKGADSYGVSWPLFFKGYGSYHLSISVYAHAITQLILPLSITSVRLVGVFSGIVFSLACGGICTIVLRKRFAESASLIPVIISPLVTLSCSFFYLHFRTGFEFTLSLAAWALGLLLVAFSLESFSSSNRFREMSAAVVGSLFFSFASFAYTPARGWVPLTIIVLALAYISRLFTKRMCFLSFVLSSLVFHLPLLYTALTRPEIVFGRLSAMGVNSKGGFLQSINYESLSRALEVLSPLYWVNPAGPPLFESSLRHIIPGLSLLSVFLAPTIIVGIACLLRNAQRSPLCLSLILLYPVGAFPASLVAINPLRCCTIGALLLIYAIVGCSLIVSFLAKLPSFSRLIQLLAILLFSISSFMLHSYSVTTATKFYGDYGFYGVQYGAREVLPLAQSLLRSGSEVSLSHESFNGNERLVDFFIEKSPSPRLAIKQASDPCILDATTSSRTWIIREERFTSFLEARELCADVNYKEISSISAPDGSIQFRVLQLSRQ